MESNKCLACGCSTSIEWHKGWAMRSGAFALLCDNCSSAYEKSKFCDEFHSDEPGWRECSLCGKRLHCGCIASESLIVLQDCGGIFCISCTKNSRLEPVKDGAGALVSKIASEGNQSRVTTHCAGAGADRVWCSLKANENGKQVRSVHEPLFQTNLNMTLVTCENSNAIVSPGYERGEQSIASPPKLLITKSNHPAPWLIMPPAKRLDIHHSLVRHAPRCNEEELQQLLRAANCTIAPLFEKVLTSCDVDRYGRLFLPKACAKEYFPIISKPEGITLPIQDVKGENLKLQYKCWTNNKGHLLYFLEGVRPWIKSTQLQCGDTVTFSLMVPKDKLLLGIRKAPTSQQIGSELKLTWQEAQGLLRPSPTSKASNMVIDGHVFEGYDEPPVFGKKSIFVKGMDEQWTQCDSCSKWRKLPGHITVPFKWTCEENSWDWSRSSCSAPSELKAEQLDSLLKIYRDNY